MYGTATIFINDKRWIKESESGILDVRFDTQTLPSGCWVVCFISRTPDGVRLVESVPYLPGVWEERYQELKGFALKVVQGKLAEEPEWLK